MRRQLDEGRLKEFRRIFYPRSIAVAGVSRDSSKMGSLWAKALMESSFNGQVYPVNPSGGELLGARIYPDLRAIPGPLDLVISCIPRASVLDLLDDCAAKQVSAVHFFTAGFRETAEPEWVQVEEEMARRARKGGFRIIGPNCIGVSCPEHGTPYGASSVAGRPGQVGFISQSGGHAGKLMVVGLARGIGFSKIASIGNCCDLGSADFLEYMAVDPKTGAIGLYLEGPRDAQRLLQVMQAASARKPVVVWKGGATAAGAKAASSHTGAMRTSAVIWTAALKQAGALEVRGVDEMADVLLLLQRAAPIGKARLGLICGLTGDAESEARLAADAGAAFGIQVSSCLSATGRIAGLAGPGGRAQEAQPSPGRSAPEPAGTSKVDRFRVLQGLQRAMDLAGANRRLDVIAVYQDIDALVGLMDRETADSVASAILKASQAAGKPVIVVSPPGRLETDRLEVEGRLSEAGLPVYPSMPRAARAVAAVRQYYTRSAAGVALK